MKKVTKHPCKTCICLPSCISKVVPGNLLHFLKDCELFSEYIKDTDIYDLRLKYIKTYTVYKHDLKYIKWSFNKVCKDKNKKYETNS